MSWSILFAFVVFSSIGISGLLYYKRQELLRGKINISFHHVPLLHLHEYSLFLNNTLFHLKKKSLLRYTAIVLVHAKFMIGRIKGKIYQTRVARRLKLLIDEVHGKRYSYMKTGKTSEFLRAMAEHKHRIRSGQ